MQSARDIYTDVINEIRIAFLDRDFARAEKVQHLPLQLYTNGETKTVETVEAQEAMFTQSCADIDKLGANNLVQTVQDARFLDASCIEGRHRTHLLRDGSPVVGAVYVSLRLDLVGGRWQVTERRVEDNDTHWATEISEMDRALSGVYAAETPTDLFQAFLDLLCEALIEGDFKLYRSLVHVPLPVIDNASTRVISTEKELEAFFFGYVDIMRGTGITDLIASARSVERLSADLIEGRYSTHALSSAREVIPPYQSCNVLRRDAGNWRMVSLTLGHTQRIRAGTFAASENTETST